MRQGKGTKRLKSVREGGEVGEAGFAFRIRTVSTGYNNSDVTRVLVYIIVEIELKRIVEIMPFLLCCCALVEVVGFVV